MDIFPYTLLTSEKAAEILGIRRQSVDYHARRGELRTLKVHRTGKVTPFLNAYRAFDVVTFAWEKNIDFDMDVVMGLRNHLKDQPIRRILMTQSKAAMLLDMSSPALSHHRRRGNIRSEPLVGIGKKPQYVFDLDDVELFAKKRGVTVPPSEVRKMKRIQEWRD